VASLFKLSNHAIAGHRIKIGHHHGGAFLGEAVPEGPADTRASAGDDNDFVGVPALRNGSLRGWRPTGAYPLRAGAAPAPGR
jgi:hypothetical protein